MNINKLDKAIIYVDRIANGYNPVSNEQVINDSVLNNPNVIRCMFFIKEILKEVKENGGVIGKKKVLPKISFDTGILDKFVYVEDKSISNFIKPIYDLIDNENMEKIKVKEILCLLKENNYIVRQMDKESGLIGLIATDKGRMIGIYNEIRSINGKDYIATIYNKNAQEFIINIIRNLERN